MWMFMVERIGTSEPDESVTYPRVVLAMGTAPDEHSKEDELFGAMADEDPYAADAEEQGYGADDLDEDEEHYDDGHFEGSGEEYH
jgi:hypothetical protein